METTEQVYIREEGMIIDPTPKSLWHYSWKRLKRNKLAMAGLVIIALLFIIAASAELIAPFNPNQQILEYSVKPIGYKGNVIIKKMDGSELQYIPIQNIIKEDNAKVYYTDFSGSEANIDKSELKGTSQKEWNKELTFHLGTDRFGRDVLSRLIFGSRVSLAVGIISESIAIFIGVLLGAMAGYFRGKTDAVIMWVINVVWAFPSILFIIALSVVLGKGFWQAFVAIGLTGWVDIARIVRGQFFSLRETEYIEATKAIGFKAPRVILKHMLPNSMGPVIVTGTVGLATAILLKPA